MKSFTFSRRIPALAAFGLIAGMAGASFAQDGGFTLGASGWGQYNLIGSSESDRGGHDGKSVLATGAELSFQKRTSDRTDVRAQLGFFTTNSLTQPNAGYNSNSYALSTVNPYVQEASFTFAPGGFAVGEMWFRGGIFPYNYNPDSKNLGQYLLRGPVYPGVVISGYETLGMMPIASMGRLPSASILGLQWRHQWGNFQGDLLLSMETQYYPYFDLSPAYVATYQVHPSLKVGAGVNFFHLIPVDGKLNEMSEAPVVNGTDTSKIGYGGTKVMATAVFDPKALMAAPGSFGPEDLKVYSEVAIIGLDNDKAHKEIYGDYMHRMPVMVGFNVPAFGQLDYLSLEVEWYGAAYSDDLSNYNKSTYSPLPVATLDDQGAPVDKNVKRDNWKWSLHAARTFQKQVQLSVQVANDHYRPGIYRGYSDSELPLRRAVMMTPKDWYLSTKIAYFF